MNIFKWRPSAKQVVKPTEDQDSAPPDDLEPTDFDSAPPDDLEPTDFDSAPPDDLEPTDFDPAPPDDLEPTDFDSAPPDDLEPTDFDPAPPDGQEALDLAPAPPAGQEPADPAPAPPEDRDETGETSAADQDGAQFESLRRLIIGPELDELETLQERLDTPDLLARTLSPAVTEALFVRTQADRKLDVVLRATVERILRSSVRRNPDEMAGHLSPVMGPALRKSVAESFRGLIQGLSGLAVKHFSPTGLKWRLRALRTGRPFSEVALLDSLEYRVEQVFLVHARTGSPLVHVINKGLPAQDDSGDQAAAMITALNQFVSRNPAEGERNDLTFGELRLCVVRRPEVYLACAVRGRTPSSLRRTMRSLLELISVDLAGELADSHGDPEPFQRSRRLLESLLVSRRKDEDRKPSPAAIFLFGLLAAMVLGPAVYYGYRKFEARSEAEAEAAMERRVHKATAVPGLSLVKAWRRPDGLWEMTFLKDELAEGPEEKLVALGLSPSQARLTILPYVSQDRELVERRAGRILAGWPETLSYSFDWSAQTLVLSGRVALDRVLAAYEALRSLPGVKAVLLNGLEDLVTGIKAELGRDQVLRLSGQASIAWREDLKEKAAAVSGLRLDLSGLEDDAASLLLKELLDRINGVVIHFGQDQALSPENQALLRRTADDLLALEKLAESMGLTVSLVIYGYTDPSSPAQRNYDLSQARARALAALLYERGSAIALSTISLGSGPAVEAMDDPQAQKKADALARRRIELRVRLDRSRASLNLD